MKSHIDQVKHSALSINPSIGKELAKYPYQDSKELDLTLDDAEKGFRLWSRTSVANRVDVLFRMAQVLRSDVDELAKIASLEMGKPIVQARAEVIKCADVCEWYADNGPKLLEDLPTSVGSKAYVAFRPLGPILAVMPWNFPYWQIIRGAVTILLGGNAYVLKHAPNVMGCAYALAKSWEKAGLPHGVFSVINVTPEGVSKAIVDARIAAVVVTGSVRAGAAIASQSGAVVKKCVLELGGSDPFVVLADADIEAAVKAAVIGRFQNAGQICISAKRIILEEPIAKEFTERFVDEVRNFTIGDALDETTFIGPMARYDLRDELHEQVQRSVKQGATLLLGGQKILEPGNFYAPTVLANVMPGMAAFDEETFGPVAAICVAKNFDHAIELANSSEFGLSGSLWTNNLTKAREAVGLMETGAVFVNGYSASDPRVPIGGIKKSGYGRELSSFGVHEFMNIQTIWFDRR